MVGFVAIKGSSTVWTTLLTAISSMIVTWARHDDPNYNFEQDSYDDIGHYFNSCPEYGLDSEPAHNLQRWPAVDWSVTLTTTLTTAFLIILTTTKTMSLTSASSAVITSHPTTQRSTYLVANISMTLTITLGAAFTVTLTTFQSMIFITILTVALTEDLLHDINSIAYNRHEHVNLHCQDLFFIPVNDMFFDGNSAGICNVSGLRPGPWSGLHFRAWQWLHPLITLGPYFHNILHCFWNSNSDPVPYHALDHRSVCSSKYIQNSDWCRSQNHVDYRPC